MMHLRNLYSNNVFAIRILCTLLTLCILSFGIYHITNTRSAEAKSTIHRELCFKSVPITANDTLWSIAQENYTDEYGSLKNYIKEIKRCNSLTSDKIVSGSALLVPFYVTINPS